MASPIQKVLTWFSKSFSRKARQLSDTILTAIMAGRDSSDEHQTRGIVESSWAALKFTDFLKRAVHRSIKVSFEQHGQKAPKLLPELEDVWDESGMTLSQKLHGADKEMRDKIVETIKAQQKQNAHAMQVARALYDGYNAGHVTRRQQLPKYLSDIVIFARRSDLTNEDRLALFAKVRKTQRIVDRLGRNGAPNKALRSAYTGLLEAIEADSEKAIERAVKTAIEEKSRYVAERIARTEAARAWADGFLARYGDDDSVVAYQWKLASRHPEFDICDLYAEADLWGLGKGIYPKDKTPMLPVHPHCLCHLAPVYRSELEGKSQVDQVAKSGKKWLDEQSSAHQRKILGIAGSKKLQEGADWRTLVRNYNSKFLAARKVNTAIAEKRDIIKKMDFEEVRDTYGLLDNVTARLWYIEHDKHIPELIDRSASIEAQARQACELRNMYRTQTRDLMADFEMRADLDKKYPNRSFEERVQDKIKRKGLTREQAIYDIYKTATKTNSQVNKSLGLE